MGDITWGIRQRNYAAESPPADAKDASSHPLQDVMEAQATSETPGVPAEEKVEDPLSAAIADPLSAAAYDPLSAADSDPLSSVAVDPLSSSSNTFSTVGSVMLSGADAVAQVPSLEAVWCVTVCCHRAIPYCASTGCTHDQLDPLTRHTQLGFAGAGGSP